MMDEQLGLPFIIFSTPIQLPKSLTLEAISFALKKSLKLYQEAYISQTTPHLHAQTPQHPNHQNKTHLQNININEGSQKDDIFKKNKKVQPKYQQFKSKKHNGLNQQSLYENPIQNKNSSKNKSQKTIDKPNLEINKQLEVGFGKNDLTSLSVNQQHKIDLNNLNQYILQGVSAKITKSYITNQDKIRRFEFLMTRKVENWQHLDKLKARQKRQLKKLQ